MDLIKNDVDPATALAAIGTLKTTALAAAKASRDRAKAKEAQDIADKGNYWTLRPYLKSLIPIPAYIIDQVKDKGISEYAVIQLPAQNIGASNALVIAQLQKLTSDPMPSGVAADVAALRTSFIESLPVVSTGGGVTSTVNTAPARPDVPMTPGDEIKAAAGNGKKYLPYIIGAAVIGLVLYFVVKK